MRGGALFLTCVACWGTSASRADCARDLASFLGSSNPSLGASQQNRDVSEFEIFVTREEGLCDQAFGVAYRAYLTAGVTQSNANGRRNTSHQTLSTSHVVVAVSKGAVIGTVTIVEDGVLGLPIDSLYRRPKGTRDVEISAFAIEPEFQRKVRLVFALSKFAWEFSRQVLNADHLYVIVHPRHAGFYRRVLFFSAVGESIEHYAAANDLPGVIMLSRMEHAVPLLDKSSNRHHKYYRSP